MNDKLAAILDWANSAEINLDKAEILPTRKRYDYKLHKEVESSLIRFYHDNEKAANMRNLKRAVSLAQESSDSTTLIGKPDMLPWLEVAYVGAFECEITRNCHPKGWTEEQLETALASVDEPDEAEEGVVGGE